MKVCPECAGTAYGDPAHCAACNADLSGVEPVEGTHLAGAVIERKYRLVEFIGEGAMGWVYRGLHLALESSVAVKLMKPSPEQDQTNDKRFAQEARAASRLNNPHVISITDFGRTPGGVLFIVSEFLRGFTLTDLLDQNGPLPVARTLRIADQLLSGLEEAHSASLVHRDLKPDNVMITPLRSGEDFVKILDFGIAKLNTAQSAHITHQGEVIGTPTYMSPEQIRGKDIVPQTDLYACGSMVFEMLTGRPPFDSESVMEVLSLHLSKPPPTLSEVAPNLEFPAGLEQAILRTLAKDPTDRFASAAELRQALGGAAAVQGALEQACPTCGHPRSGAAKFCEECGAPLHGESATQIPAVTQRPMNRNRVATQDTVCAVDDAGVPSGATPRVAATLKRRLRAEVTSRFALVGRQQETAALEGFLRSDRHIARICGEEGSGRTRLLREVVLLSLREGINPIWLAPDPTLARTPWYAVRRLIGAVLQLGNAPELEAIREAVRARHLADGDVRGLAVLFGVEEPGSYVEHAVRLRETRAAAMRALLHNDQGRPQATLCILVDDADELDGASARFLQDLVDAIGDSPHKLVVAGEEAVISDERVQLTLEPPPLTEADVERLLRDLPSRRDSWLELAGMIHRTSGGNPLRVVQALRLLLEGGGEVDAPVADLVSMRVSFLPGEAREVLQVVSVVGQAASFDQVAKLVTLDETHLEEALQLLIRRQLLQDGPGGSLAVGHPVIARTVRESIPADAREQLHRQLLEHLEAHHAPAIAMARHAAAANLQERAVELLLEAGAASEAMLDDVGAARHYRQALQLARWQLLKDEADPVCLDLSLRLANALRYADDLNAAEMVLRESLLCATDDPARHARLLHSMALLELRLARHETAVETMQYAVRQAFFSAQPVLLNQMYIDLGKVLDCAGMGYKAAAELEEGVLVVTSGDGPKSADAPDSFWRLLAQLAELQFHQGEVERATESVGAALEQATRQGSRIGQARCHYLLARCLDRQGQVAEADAHHAQALDTFRRLGDRRSAAEVLLSQASLAAGRRPELTRQALDLSLQISWEPGIRAAESMSPLS